VAVVVAGLVLLPSVILYAHFARVISTAGSAYVWMTTALGPRTGFVVGFVYFVGVLGSMGFLAYVFSTFIGTFCDGLGATGLAAWCAQPVGRFITGILLIAVVLLINLRGAEAYGRIVSVMFFGVLVAAATTVFYGLTTAPQIVVSGVGKALGTHLTPPASDEPSGAAFFAVVTLFVYLYGGISAAPSLGGESRDEGTTLARGLLRGWLVALVLYAAVAFSLFQAVPWWVVHPAVVAHNDALVTIPGLIGLMAPLSVSLIYKAIIIVVAGKTSVPLMFDCSRNLYAWAVDGHVPKIFATLNSRRVPSVALAAVALITILFLAESVYGGFSIGVALRAISLVLVSVMVGAGAFRIFHAERFKDSDLRAALATRRGVLVAAALTQVFGLVLIYFGLYQSGLPLVLQPGVQGAIAGLVAFGIYYAGAKRRQLQNT
jgi:amino acid transporter